MHSQILTAFFAYFCILLSIGLIAHKKQTSSVDFIMGNRSLNFWLTALSAHASDMSAWLFMGFPAAVMIGGLSGAWIGIGLALGMFLNWHFVAKKLRTQTEKYDSYTLSTFFEKRFNDTSGILRVLTASITVFFLICYLSAGLIAMGLLFESVFGIDYYLGLSIASVVVVTYTFVGGYVTVAWTDLFQAIFLLAVIVIVPSVAFTYLPNGFSTILDATKAQSISLSLIENTSTVTLLSYFFLMCWGFGYFGQPHIVTKFMGIKNASDMNKSKYVGMTWQIVALSCAAIIGIIGIGFFREGIANPELVFVELVKTIFNPWLAGFILCAVLAANMSTMDSQILVCASVLSEDFYKRVLRRPPSQKELLNVSRLSVVLVAVLSLSLAFQKSTTILEAVQYAWFGLGTSFGPLVLMSLYSKTANRYGAIAGIIVGSVVAGGWDFVNPYFSDYTIPSILPGFALSFSAIYIVSKLTEAKISRSAVL